MNCILQMWNNVISIHFKDEDCTKEWQQTLTMDFEGKYRQVRDLFLFMYLFLGGALISIIIIIISFFGKVEQIYVSM